MSNDAASMSGRHDERREGLCLPDLESAEGVPARAAFHVPCHILEYCGGTSREFMEDCISDVLRGEYDSLFQ